MVKKELFELYATNNLDKLQYKILLLLLHSDRHQKEMSELLNTPKQNINKAVKELASMDFIKVANQIGQVKILSINTSPAVQIKGQISIF